MRDRFDLGAPKTTNYSEAWHGLAASKLEPLSACNPGTLLHFKRDVVGMYELFPPTMPLI